MIKIKAQRERRKRKKEIMSSIKKIDIVAGLIFLTFFISSCSPGYVFEKKNEIKNSLWKKDNVVSFNVNITDTVQYHNIYLFINNNNSYNFSNLYLFISVYTPSGNCLKDTTEFYLADDKGKWYGKKKGDEYLNRILYKKNVIFQKPGNYIFKIEQAMRVENINITSVGLAVEKHKN
jgi:gliding motility-associated lipoprotein GldH